NTTGANNTAIGLAALFTSDTAKFNTAIGNDALLNNTGGENTAIGNDAGRNATNGFSNVYIGNEMVGVAGESSSCYIASIFGQTSASGVPVLINLDSKLGTATSSKRFKEEIHPMGDVSEALFAFMPVSFRYKKE